MTFRRESDVVRRPSPLPWKLLEPARRARIVFAFKECRVEFEWDIANLKGFFQSISKRRFWSCHETDPEVAILKTREFTGFLRAGPFGEYSSRTGTRQKEIEDWKSVTGRFSHSAPNAERDCRKMPETYFHDRAKFADRAMEER